jgi:hypothetical protein
MDKNVQDSDGLEGKTICSDEYLLAESIAAVSVDADRTKSLHAQRNGLRRLKSRSETHSAHGDAEEEESQFFISCNPHCTGPEFRVGKVSYRGGGAVTVCCLQYLLKETEAEQCNRNRNASKSPPCP